MNFASPDRVAEIIDQLKQVDIVSRAPARTLVDALYNGQPPFTEAEAKENQLGINCNFGEASDLLLQARQQFESAFLSTGNFFSIRVPDAPESKRQDYEGVLTEEANRPMKKSLPFLHTQRQKWGSVALHGPGPTMWPDDEDPLPFFVAIPDLLIPTDTDITLDNLNYFAVRRRMKPGQLWRKTLGKGKNIDPGWNVEKVTKLLCQYKDQNTSFNNTDPYTQPERWNEVYKQNLIYWDSDVAPTITFWDFYFSEDEAPYGSWKRGIIMDSDCVPSSASNETPLDWVYEPKRVYADKLSHILHVQFSDGNNVPPFMYRSCRGLGLRLYDTVMLLNRFRCQSLQKMFEDLVPLFRVVDPADKARLAAYYIGMAYGVIPDGLHSVGRDQRYSPDPKLMEMALSGLKQLLGEGSTGYTQDIDNGTSKERTAFEVNALLNQSTKITSSMLNLAYLQESFADEEIVRRLFLPKTHNFISKRVQAKCLERGVPKKWMDSSRMVVEHERVLGSGNSQIEMAQAQALFGIRQALSPKGQAIVTNKYAFSITHDPALTNEVAPRDGAPHVTDSIHDTELVFGTFMAGGVVTPKSGTNPIEVVETGIKLIGAVVQQINQTGGVGTPAQVQGLNAFANYLGQYMQQLSQDEVNKQRVKQYGDVLGKLMNQVKAFQQRQQQAAQQQNGNGNGIAQEDMVKAQLLQQSGQQKLIQKQQSHQQKLTQSQQSFAAKQQQDKAKTLSDISLKTAAATAQSRSKPPPSPEEASSDDQ